MKTRITAKLLVAASAIGLLFAAADASAFGSGRILRGNAEGGFTAGKFRANQGPNGGGYVHGRRTTTDGNGDVTTSRGTAFRGPNGGSGTRYGSNTVNADGNASHQSGLSASGERGSVETSGSASRSADGTVQQSRNTTLTNASTGNTMNVSESYSKGSGVTRSASCSDASGNAIPCPSR